MSSIPTLFPYFYLASQSPRRQELLSQIAAPYRLLKVHYSDELERLFLDETPIQYLKRICQAKLAVAQTAVIDQHLPLAPILVADTIVTLDQYIFGKPKDQKDAQAMLMQISGKVHEVLTAVSVLPMQKNRSHFAKNPLLRISRSQVKFAQLSIEDIAQYIKTQEPLDKAGAYGIQGQAARFIKKINGSYSGIMGLPIFETSQLLHAAFIDF